MRRITKILLGLILVVPMIAATTMYLATEKKYAFTAENLAATIPEFIEEEQKQIAFAEKWVSLMDPETGAVSVADIFAACRAGGFNTYKEVGFTQCRALIVKLIENAEGELDEEFLNGFCPGLDENGKNPNALSTITDKTRIGDFCSSSHIAGGEVVFRKGYNCTCRAFACNEGYESKGGACVTKVADGNGNCLRKEYTGVNSLPDGVLKFCESKAVKGCKIKNGIKDYNGEKGKVVCNATQDEFDMAKARILNNTDNKIAALQYYEVCGQHRGKTGKKEYCVEDVFGDVDTGLNEAAGLSQLYAKEKYGKTIYCDTKYREKSNDDYMKCATLEKDTFFEFRFDDLSESNDDAKFADTIMGLAAIYGYKSSSNVISGPCTIKIQNAAKKLGMTASSWSNGKCALYHGVQITSNKNLNSKLRGIDGLDCTVGKNIQTQGSTEVRNKLLSYIRAQGFVVTDFECDNGYGTIYNGTFSGSDDVLTCRVSGTFNGKRYSKQPVDFVFDDMSEGKKYQQKAGDQGLNCVAYNGNFDGHYCRKLTKEECFQLEDAMLAELKKNGKYTGDNDLVDWDEAAGACELNDAQVANNINKTGKYTAIVGLTVAGAFSGGTTSAVALSLMAVELAGVVGEVYTERKVDLLPQEWANAFLAESRKCNNSSCAETTLRNNFQKIAQASDKLNRDVLNQVDTEMARLAEKIPDSRLQQILDTSEPPSCWDTWECQRWIFVGMQCASLVVSVGNGLVKMTGVFAKKAGTVTAKTGTKALTAGGAHADDVAKLASHSDDVARGAVKSTKEELAEIGVAESKAYRDVKTGQMISKDEVLARIDRMPGGTGANKTLNEELAEIGVREESVYRDIASNKFISRDEVLRRIDNMPATPAPKTNEKLLNMFNGANVDDAGRALTAAEREYNVMDKMLMADGEFTTKLARIKNGTTKELVVPSNRLTEEEWKVLSDSLKKEGFEVVDYPAPLGLSQKGIRKAGGAGDAGRVVNGAGNTTSGATHVDDVAGLRAKVGGDFDQYIAQAKTSPNINSGVRIPKDRMTEEEWGLLNKSLEKDGVKFSFDGSAYELVRVRGNANDVQNAINRALKGGGEYYIPEERFTSSQWNEIQNAIKHKDVQFVKQGDGYLKLVRVSNYDLDIVKGAKSFSGNVGRYRVSLEKLPVQGGGTSEVVNIGGRAVAVVNVNGRRIPFYVSSGQAGKDAIGIPSGKWYPIAGIGKDGRGWFNKMPDMTKNPVRELDEIANRLDQNLNAQKLKQMALDTQSGMSSALPEPASGAYRIINSEFKKGVVPELEATGQQGVGQMPEKYVDLYNQNIELIKNIFR